MFAAHSGQGLNIVDLPLDLLDTFFQTLKDVDDDCSAVCLALTCRALYKTYKSMNKPPIDLCKGFS